MISVCMPYYMRQRELDRSLEAYDLAYPDLGMEISICDDGSPVPVIAPWCKVHRLQEKDYALNPCVPMNIAVRQSREEVIVLTNPEIEHRENVFEEMLDLLRDSSDYVVAPCRDADTGAWLAGERVDYARDGRLPVPPGAHFHFCAMLYRSLFELAGGFDEDYRNGQACEDNDWLWRLHSVGANFKLAKGVVWHHRSRLKWNLPHNRDLFLRKWGLH